MRHGKSKRTFAGAAWTLILTLVALSGCANVRELDTTPTISTPDLVSSPASTESKDHNLAVLAVDFDPPLSYQQLILDHQSVALLVAVENVGASSEQNVMVRAQLTTPEDPEFSISQGASVESIAPGEVQVVRFSQLGKIPYHQVYRLEVIVDPVQGEKIQGDNSKTFEVDLLKKN